MNSRPFVFVLMPFDSVFEDIYKLGIKAACEATGARCERVDEQMYDERILDRIYSQIKEADIIVADMTGRNPNVFYEVGYAHGHDRNVILLTQKAEDIPFDLKHHPHIVYDGKIVRLKEELQKRISWSVERLSNVHAKSRETRPAAIPPTRVNPNVAIEQALRQHRWRLCFSPRTGQSKLISFLDGGAVGEGRNKNEYLWSVVDGKLVIFNDKNFVFARFSYNQQTKYFQHTGDLDTASINKDHYMMVEK